ncbi:Sfi1 spindle body protein-domain-containing protein [Tricladium varicosporioides]|nr:Sfi1 spindle body protein-domain-containing protein [Hymenoscyphus varicosporioides]
MPPSGIPPPSNEGQSATQSEEPYYSNEDVAILNDIVVLAQELLPKLPERERLPTNALFNAYYDILPRLGIDADHDSRYARVLFKIGGLRGQDSLFEKFEEILSRMGIEIEFGNDEDDEESQQLEDSAAADLEDATAGTTPPQDLTSISRGRLRRNSESSKWSAGGEHPLQLEQKRNSFSSVPEQDDQSGTRPRFFAEMQQSRPSAPDPEHANRRPEEALDPRIGAWLNAHHNLPRRRRGRSASTHGSLRIRRRSTSRTPRRTTSDQPPLGSILNEIQPTRDLTAVTLGDGTSTEDISPSVLQGLRIIQDSASLMNIKAGLILRHHLSFLAKRQIQQWREKALRQKQYRLALERRAIDHDSNIVYRLVLALWQAKWIEIRQVRHTEQFFAHLEFRATRARDLYLMLKVLQHWSDHTREQIDRTNAARRHILRTRYFNAWAEITAVNEFKVRRHVLKKFFEAWRQRQTIKANDSAIAIQKYEYNLVERSYKKWIRRLWEAKARAWWAEGVKRRILFRWIVVYHNSWEDHRVAEEERCNEAVWKAWRAWRSLTEERIRQREEAERSDRARLCRNTIRKWRRETQVIPAKIMVQSDVKYRIVRETFGVWLHRAQQEVRASEVDRGRILREAVVTWRHKVRQQITEREVDRRIARQTIYKWFVAQRSTTFRRQRRKKLLCMVFEGWIQKAENCRRERWQQEDVAQAYATQKLQNSVLANWYRQMQIHKEQEISAISFSTTPLLQGVLFKWSERITQLQQLEQRSKDAEFYFLTSKILKQWKALTETAKRDKRKIAYAKVRRTTKMNLARGIIRNWRQKADRILDLQDQAKEVRQNKITVLGMNIFDKWRGRSEELAEMEALSRENILKKQFAIWASRSKAYQALKTEAILTYEENRQNRALKKWNLALLQLRAQTNYAYDVREKNAKRTFRKMWTYWRQKAAQKRPPRIVEPEENDQNDRLGITTRAEVWSDFGDGPEGDDWAKGLDDITTSTPIPGYLSTPSKRSERVMAVAARFSTTPKAPLSTPFERQLRAQYSGGQLHSFRKGLGKSTMSMGGFADIEEKPYE